MFFFLQIGSGGDTAWSLEFGRGQGPKEGAATSAGATHWNIFFQPILSQETLMLRCRVCYERRHDHRMCSRCPEHGELLIHVRDHLPKKKMFSLRHCLICLERKYSFREVVPTRVRRKEICLINIFRNWRGVLGRRLQLHRWVRWWVLCGRRRVLWRVLRRTQPWRPVLGVARK